MKYKAVIFDMDGTLLNTLEDLAVSTDYALRKCGYPERTLDEVRGFVGNGVERLISLSVPDGTKKDDELRCLEIFKKHYAANSRIYTKPYDGIAELLFRLKDINIKIGVVSNKFHAALTVLCDDFFGSLTDYAVGSKQGIPKKPSPECVFECMNALGCTAGETLYVGDSEVDVMTAENAGLKCAGVLWGFRDEALLKTLGTDYIVSKPSEIYDIVIGEKI